MDLFLRHIRIMLSGQNHRFQTDRLIILVIFHGNLALSIGPQVREGSVLAYRGQLPGEFMRQADGIRHILFRLIGRVAEHHSLIPGSDCPDLFLAHSMLCALLLRLQCLVHTHSDICGLLIQHHHHAAGIGIKAVIRFGISDLAHRIPYDLLDVHISVRGDFSHHHHQASSGAGLAGNPAHRILFHQGIQNGIGNRIAHLIGMSFSHGFGSE